ncbi:hypothetical protein [Nocardiopsis quinghaiensis]|uniref:hypothetical protein n=1 Tax=Nocardiopsis quinghaiensis TaxID=464995 RepID=UPI00123AB50B|nr:hypothetical protein [Nocardiopsis quinghaiensis]
MPSSPIVPVCRPSRRRCSGVLTAGRRDTAPTELSVVPVRHGHVQDRPVDTAHQPLELLTDGWTHLPSGTGTRPDGLGAEPVDG